MTSAQGQALGKNIRQAIESILSDGFQGGLSTATTGEVQRLRSIIASNISNESSSDTTVLGKYINVLQRELGNLVGQGRGGNTAYTNFTSYEATRTSYGLDTPTYA